MKLLIRMEHIITEKNPNVLNAAKTLLKYSKKKFIFAIIAIFISLALVLYK